VPAFEIQFPPEQVPELAARRALESLGVKPRSQYPISFWLGYLEECGRRESNPHGL
jgi:hypothetical protein